MKHKLILAITTVMLLASGLVATVAQAETAATITFEAPTYTTGTIHNQDGWSSSGSTGAGSPGFDHQVAAQSLYSSFGNQSLRISNAVTSGSFGDQTFSRSLVDEAGESSAENGGMSGGNRQPSFTAQWDFASATGAYQAGLVFSISPDRGDGARMSWVQLADTPDGLEAQFGDYQSGIGFVYTVVASGLDRTVPHTIELSMDFVDGAANDVVTITVDGTSTHTGTSWEDYFRDVEANQTRTVDSLLFRTAGPAVTANQGNGFLIDNLALESGEQATSGEMLDDLQESTAELVTHRKSQRTLLAALDRAERFIDTRPGVACGALFQYTFQVQLFEAFGLIESDDADQLLAQARQLSDSVC